jgi:hypothetical protein
MTDRRARRDPYAAPPRPARHRDVYDDDAGYDDRYEPPDRGPAVSPGAVFLVIAVIGSIAFTAYFLTVREATQIPLLAAASVVLAIVFAALAAYCLRTVWRGGVEHVGGGRLLVVAIVGGVAAIAAAGAAAGAIILFQLSMTSG